MPRTVMIIEDHPVLEAQLVDLVEGWGFRVLLVTSTDEAIRAVGEEDICLVLLDPMTASADHSSLVYEGGGKPIVVVPVALRVAPPEWRIERFLVAPESLRRIVHHHCADTAEAELGS